MKIKFFFLPLFLSLLTTVSCAQSQQISMVADDEGMKLVVEGKDFMVNGMNWDYYPIGTNYTYSLWKQTDELIIEALDAEMTLLKNMGVNTIRQYMGVPPKWIQYIYEKYGIYTMLNHTFGRYGLPLKETWVANTDYADSLSKVILLTEVKKMAEDYQDTPGLLLYLLGNENNYGLFWEGAETEDIPVKDKKSTHHARAMYRLFNEAALLIKEIDDTHPIVMCNGDLLFLDLIVEECAAIDIFGTNMYRGASFGDTFQKVKEALNKPLLFTEFGADAFNAINHLEEEESQAYYLVENWKEIYQHAAGAGKTGNCLGGFTFQFSDGWWKFGQTKNLDIHDENASWVNGGYVEDYMDKTKNNMNEEWFGICAKGPTNPKGLYQLRPRVAYHVLKRVHQLNPYDEDITLDSIENHFSNIQKSLR